MKSAAGTARASTPEDRVASANAADTKANWTIRMAPNRRTPWPPRMAPIMATENTADM